MPCALAAAGSCRHPESATPYSARSTEVCKLDDTPIVSGVSLLYSYLRKYRSLILLALVLAATNQVFSLLDPLIFRHVIDQYATRFQEYTTGQFFKGVSLLLGAAVEAMAEASAMVSRHGIPPADFLNVLTSGVFASPAYQTYGAAIAQQRYDPPGFKLKLTLKDLRLALAAAEDASVPMPLADVVHESLLEAVAHGDGERDLAALAAVSMRRAGQDALAHSST